MTENVLPHLDIAIVGGGPGGLILARILQQKSSANVKVYERSTGKDSHYWQQGASLNLMPGSGFKTIKEAGLLTQFKEHYRSDSTGFRMMDKNGKLLTSGQAMSDDLEARDRGAWSPAIDRGTLVNLLYDSLDEGTVEWNKHFKSLRQEGDKLWRLEFHDGSTATADLVVGADGGRSHFRSYVTPVKPVYSGITIVEGTIAKGKQTAPNIYEMVEGGKTFVVDRDRSLVLTTKANGTITYYLGVRVPEKWDEDCGLVWTDKEKMFSWFKFHYHDWSPKWHELVEKSTDPFYPRPQFFMPVNQPWEHKPNITMLGDAAHVMPPFGAQGVNMALTDGLELAKHLIDQKRHPTTVEAIAAYEKAMRKRVGNSVRFAKLTTTMFHSNRQGLVKNMMKVAVGVSSIAQRLPRFGRRGRAEGNQKR